MRAQTEGRKRRMRRQRIWLALLDLGITSRAQLMAQLDKGTELKSLKGIGPALQAQLKEDLKLTPEEWAKVHGSRLPWQREG